MVIRQFAAAVVVLVFLAAHSAYAQDNYALDYSAGGQVVGEGAIVGGPPATVNPMSPPTLGYNYYYPMPGTGQVPARLYLCPRPTPAHVGYTYITYQALNPHEFLWRHRATYVTPYNGGTTITTVRWK